MRATVTTAIAVTSLIALGSLLSCANFRQASVREEGVAPGPPSAQSAPAARPHGNAVQDYSVSAMKMRVQQAPGFHTEAYDRIEDNEFRSARETPLSTFSIDVDTASYSNVRRFLGQGRLPPADAVRIEELVNYFSYAYPMPRGDAPFGVHTEVAECPWQPGHLLARISLKARDLPEAERPAANLVFLVDVSGSMQMPGKLSLVKRALRLLAESLRPEDRVSLVVYAGAAGMVLPPTSGADSASIVRALERLEAGGSTNGGEGIRLAYQTALKHHVPGGMSRVVLATDGDFNVGVTSQGELIRLVEDHARAGVALSVLGFGMGNYKDSMLEKLADRGDGNHAYIDNLHEARKVLVEQVGGTLFTVAKDVKIQVEFNPLAVSRYRLIGYENRLMHAEDFDNDKKDAGEVGAGHEVTAFYELVPAQRQDARENARLRYQQGRELTAQAGSGELLNLKLRYKDPAGGASRLLEFSVADQTLPVLEASDDFRFAAAVAAFGMLLRDSEHRGQASFESVRGLADPARGADEHGYRSEFMQLLRKAEALQQG